MESYIETLEKENIALKKENAYLKKMYHTTTLYLATVALASAGVIVVYIMEKGSL